jgi:putative copper resistance protein D
MTLIDPLAAVRAIHFAAAIVVAGASAFSVLVSKPALRVGTEADKYVAADGRSITRLIWIALATALTSAMAWLVLVAAEITGGSWSGAIGDGTAYAVLTDTQFGLVVRLRVLVAAALAGLLLLSGRRQTGAVNSFRIAVAMTAAVFLGLLAWIGHAGSASGGEANVHLIADILHLLAAGAWIGGLFPLAILLARLGRMGDRQSMVMCAQILRRFSNLGVAMVAALFVSGIVNAWFLTAHMRDLVGTDYGELLQIKIGLFLLMLCLAADNRLRLLPRIAQAQNPRSAQALGKLRRNVSLEIALGLVVIYVVGVLGLTPPPGHVHAAHTSACEDARWL